MAEEPENDPTQLEPQVDPTASVDADGVQSEDHVDAEAVRDGVDESADAPESPDSDEVHIRRNLTRDEKRIVDGAAAAARALTGGFSPTQQRLHALGALADSHAAAAAAASFAPAGFEARWGESISALRLAGVGTEKWRTAPSATAHLEALSASFQDSLNVAMGAAFTSQRWWNEIADGLGISKGYQALLADLDPGWLGAATQAFDPAETYRELLARPTAQDAFARLGTGAVVAERFASILSGIELDADADVVAARIESEAPNAMVGAPQMTRRDIIAIGGYITLVAFSLLVLLHLTHPELADELSDIKEYAEIAVLAGVTVYKLLEHRGEE